MLDGVITGKTAKPRRVILAGIKGIGKSTWAAGAPDPIFVQAEEGLEDIGAPRFPQSKTFDDLYNRLIQLGEKEHKYRTVAVDSLDGVQDLIFAKVVQDHGKKNIEDIGYAKGYTFALDYWRKLVGGFEYLRNECSMNVVLIAHTKIERFEDPEQANYDRWTLQLHKHAIAFLTQWADEVFFATYRIYLNTEKGGFGKDKVRGVGNGERLIYTTERPGHVAKNRLDMPDEIDFPKTGGWDIYAKYIQAHHSPKPAETAPPAAAVDPKTKKAKTAVAS